MTEIRAKAEVLGALQTLNLMQHEELQKAGAEDPSLWIKKDHALGQLVAIFRGEVKGYYYNGQKRRCCYCSKELDRHQGTFDADHILHRSGFPWLMFHLSNIAACCKTCGGRKSNKNVLAAEGGHPQQPPSESGDYLIVHPHLDEWDEFLKLDQFRRIVPNGDSPKGSNTIRICGIDALNNARLADHFSANNHRLAERAIEKFYSSKHQRAKDRKIALLIGLAELSEPARQIVELLQVEARVAAQ